MEARCSQQPRQVRKWLHSVALRRVGCDLTFLTFRCCSCRSCEDMFLLKNVIMLGFCCSQMWPTGVGYGLQVLRYKGSNFLVLLYSVLSVALLVLTGVSPIFILVFYMFWCVLSMPFGFEKSVRTAKSTASTISSGFFKDVLQKTRIDTEMVVRSIVLPMFCVLVTKLCTWVIVVS